MEVLLIDNYDSFTWNLVDYVSVTGCSYTVETNDLRLETVKETDPDGIIISPGPGHPAKTGDVGNVPEILESCQDTPVLGVCLGHQMIAEQFGGEVERADMPVHGKASHVEHDGDRIYEGIPQGFPAGRYHSLVVRDVPEELEVVSTGDDVVMGLRHRELPMEGVQFHPESVLTSHGHKMIENFLDYAGNY
ncbi:MAG: aminodeoxychorismate/anthranilate synthase component II [Halobacteria archaeon]